MSKYVTIIPARGGSKRLPNKNTKELNGLPLIAHSILYAKRHLFNSEIWVSTDSKEIANIAYEYGAKVINRPAELSNDTATTAAALKHAVAVITNQGVAFDYVVLLQATNPLRPKNLLTEAINIIERESCGALVSFNPISRKMGRIVNGRYTPWNYEIGQRSQDMEPLYYENGLLYITHRRHIENGIIFPDDTYPMVIEHPFGSIDIDVAEDFAKAEFYIKHFSEDE